MKVLACLGKAVETALRDTAAASTGLKAGVNENAGSDEYQRGAGVNEMVELIIRERAPPLPVSDMTRASTLAVLTAYDRTSCRCIPTLAAGFT